MDKSYCICGLSTFGYRAATSLYRAGKEVLAIDRSADLVERIRDDVTQAICADLNDREVLRSVGALDCDVAIVALPKHFDAAVLTVHFFRQEGMKRIIAEVNSEEQESAIEVVGASDTVFPDRDAAERMVKTFTTPGLVELFVLSRDAELIEVRCPQSFIGKSLQDLRIRGQFGVHVVAIKKPADPATSRPERTVIAPLPESAFEKGDIMIVLGSVEKLSGFEEAISREPPGED